VEQQSSVGAGYVSGLLDAALRAGVSRADLLRHAGLAAEEAHHANARMPMADVIGLFQSAVALTGRADIGLEFARQVRPGTFNVLGYALMTCKTLGEAIALVPHYRRLVFDIGYSEMQFVSTHEEARLGWHVVSKSAYEEFFECPVHFNAAENALVFSKTLLDMPLVQADETLHLAMRAQAQAAMEKTFNETDLAHRLRQALIPLMPKCEATLEKASAVLHMSPRSLQRRLGEADLKFQGVLDAVRKDMAVVYLRDPALSILDVALLLGYAEQSSFTRAFKGWFVASPSAWRRAPGGPVGALVSAQPRAMTQGLQ
jgi:AraC-like DNA-binding protein